MMKKYCFLIFCCLTVFLHAKENTTQVFESFMVNQRLNGLFSRAEDEQLIPGGVVCFINADTIAFLHAYGLRSLLPEQHEATVDSKYDLSTLSSTISTGSVALSLILEGKLSLFDQVKDYVPSFKSPATLQDLLEHTSGLPASIDIAELESLYQQDTTKRTKKEWLVAHLGASLRTVTPGKKRIYSPLNFIILQALIESATSQTLDKAADQLVFKPNGMKNTGYTPKDIENTAPTERKINSQVPSEAGITQDMTECWTGITHDPLTRVMMDGVSGSAGVFSTAEDLAKWCIWFMNLSETDRFNGAYAGMHPETDGSWSQAGYAGTYVRVHPKNKQAFVFLANRVHPDDSGNLMYLNKAVYNTCLKSVVEREEVEIDDKKTKNEKKVKEEKKDKQEKDEKETKQTKETKDSKSKEKKKK